MKKWTLVTSFILVAITSNAQLREIPINISYFGENLIHLGLKVGVEYPIWETEKTKTRHLNSLEDKRVSKNKVKQLYITGNLGFYNHANNHSALFLSSELAYRRIKQQKGQILGVNLGIGYLLRISNIDVLEVDSNGNIVQASRLQGQFLTTLAFNYGRDLSIKHDIPMSWHIKPTIMLMTPYNHTIVPNAALEMGITYKLGNK